MSSEKTIWVVDDVPEIIFSFCAALANYTEYRIVYVPFAREVKAVSGDIVFLDLNGTGAAKLETPAGVRVYKMTGGFSEADLYKPFSDKDVENLVRDRDLRSSYRKAA